MSASTSTDPWLTPDGALADVGILCVHGIGVQEEGGALLAAAEALLSAIAGDEGIPNFGETVLKLRPFSTPEPAHVCAILPVNGPAVRAIVAESWWARSFDPPSYWKLLGWLLSYGTWIVIRHAVFQVSGLVRLLERWYRRRGARLPDWVDGIFAYPGAFVAVFIVAIPFQLILFAIGLLALIPIKLTQDLAKRIAVSISAVLGDASVFTANVAIRQAILTRVRSDLDWLAARCKMVVILAHSQGAAVTFDLLRRMGDLGKVRLVTYGSGVRKLSELEEDSNNKPAIVRISSALWLLGLIAGVMAWFGVAYTVESLATPGTTTIGDRVGSLLWFYLFGFFVILSVFYHTARGRDEDIDRRLKEQIGELMERRLQWADLYASSDPVPAGPVLGAFALAAQADGWRGGEGPLSGFRSREVVNRLSSFVDHTTYWETPNDFVPAVATQIRAWLGLPAIGEPMNLGRKTRMIFRKVAGLLLGATLIALYLRAGNPLRDLVLLPAWDTLPIDATSLTGRAIARYHLREIAVFAAGLAIYLALAWSYARFILDPAWSAWERTIQRYRSDAFADADNLIGVLARMSHLVGPTIRFLICIVLLAIPLWLLGGAVVGSNYAMTIDSLILAGEWGREGVVLLIWLVIVFFGIAAVYAGVEWVRDNWKRH